MVRVPPAGAVWLDRMAPPATVTMPVESASASQARLGGALTLTTDDGVERVLSGGMVDLDTGAVSFIVQGIGWPYDGNRITLMVADVGGKVTTKVKGKKTRVKVKGSPMEMGNVKDFPGDIWFPSDIWSPGDAFSTGTVSVTWSEFR